MLPYWYAGWNGWLTGGGLDVRLWNRLGTTRILRTLCAANTSAGQKAVYGDLPGADPRDIDHASLVVLWGCNPSASGIHLVPKLRAVQARGGKLVVVDPRRTPLAKQADLAPRAPARHRRGRCAMALARLAFAEGPPTRPSSAAGSPTPTATAPRSTLDPGAGGRGLRRARRTESARPRGCTPRPVRP